MDAESKENGEPSTSKRASMPVCQPYCISTVSPISFVPAEGVDDAVLAGSKLCCGSEEEGVALMCTNRRPLGRIACRRCLHDRHMLSTAWRRISVDEAVTRCRYLWVVPARLFGELGRQRNWLRLPTSFVFPLLHYIQLPPLPHYYEHTYLPPVAHASTDFIAHAETSCWPAECAPGQLCGRVSCALRTGQPYHSKYTQHGMRNAFSRARRDTERMMRGPGLPRWRANRRNHRRRRLA